jgi:hypothetical protein
VAVAVQKKGTAVVPLENCTGTGSAVAVLLAPSTSAVVMAVMGDHSTAGVSVVAHTVAVVMALPTVVGAGGYGKTREEAGEAMLQEKTVVLKTPRNSTLACIKLMGCVYIVI